MSAISALFEDPAVEAFLASRQKGRKSSFDVYMEEMKEKVKSQDLSKDTYLDEGIAQLEQSQNLARRLKQQMTDQQRELDFDKRRFEGKEDELEGDDEDPLVRARRTAPLMNAQMKRFADRTAALAAPSAPAPEPKVRLSSLAAKPGLKEQNHKTIDAYVGETGYTYGGMSSPLERKKRDYGSSPWTKCDYNTNTAHRKDITTNMREGPLHLAHIFQSKVSRSADKLPDAHLRQCIQNLEQSPDTKYGPTASIGNRVDFSSDSHMGAEYLTGDYHPRFSKYGSVNRPPVTDEMPNLGPGTYNKLGPRIATEMTLRRKALRKTKSSH